MATRRKIKVTVNRDSTPRVPEQREEAFEKASRDCGTPSTSKEALFRWAEKFVDEYQEDFDELARR